MFRPAFRWFCLLLFVPVCIGCGGGEEEPFRKQTSVVKGTVTVDGAPPSSALIVECHPVGGIDKEHPSVSNGMTNDLGVFELSTYEKGDGIPPGDYVLTFRWQDYNMISNSYGGPDKLNGRYSDPKTSEFKLSVKGSEPIDMGIIELTTGGEEEKKE